jgi:hypothetical protein
MERLDLVDGISAPRAIQRSRNELVHLTDRANARRSDGSYRSYRGARKQYLRGDTGSAMQPNMRVRSSTQDTMVEWEFRPARRVRGAKAMPPTPCIHWPWRDRLAVVRRPRAHRGRITTRSWPHWHRSPPCLDNRADRICLGPAPPAACTHGVLVELAPLALAHAEDAHVLGLALARAAWRDGDGIHAQFGSLHGDIDRHGLRN